MVDDAGGDELYDSIYGSFLKHRRIETEEDRLFVHELTLEAVEGASEYVRELEEAIGYHLDTIKSLSGGWVGDSSG